MAVFVSRNESSDRLLGVLALATRSDTVSAAFDPSEEWDVLLQFNPIPGLGIDFGPRTFGLHPDCTQNYDLQFAGQVQCDSGRLFFSDPEVKISFYYPGYPDDSPSQDEKRLLTSRYVGAGEDFLPGL